MPGGEKAGWQALVHSSPIPAPPRSVPTSLQAHLDLPWPSGEGPPWPCSAYEFPGPDPCHKASPTPGGCPGDSGPTQGKCRWGWQQNKESSQTAWGGHCCHLWLPPPPGPHLGIAQQHRSTPLNQKLCHFKVATIQGIVQGSNALAPGSPRVVNGSSVVQEQTDNLWREEVLRVSRLMQPQPTPGASASPERSSPLLARHLPRCPWLQASCRGVQPQ